MNIDVIKGGITAPKGFLASGIHCGLKKSKKDLALIYSTNLCNSAAVFTSNIVKGAPIYISKDNLKNNKAQAIIINSGNANTCNGDDGIGKAKLMASLEADQLNISCEDVLVASTGVIGVPLNIDLIKDSIPELTKTLSKEGGNDASSAILTTDTHKKEIALKAIIGGTEVKFGAMAKGSGMIEPNMCTMLSFITCDINIEPNLLQEALKSSADLSYNRISVDGDQSTNDSLFILANGLSKNPMIQEKNEDYYAFLECLNYINITLAKSIASDGEGSTKLIECKINGAKSIKDALKLSKSVINSPLVKTAMFGCDANWGRILCALGYADVPFDPKRISVNFESKIGSINVCANGQSVSFDEGKALEILKQDEIIIDVNLNLGSFECSTWGCDLSYEYVKINGEYRS